MRKSYRVFGFLIWINLAVSIAVADDWPQWMGEKPMLFATGFIIENHDKYYLFNDIGELMIAHLSPDGFKVLDRAKLLEPTSTARGRQVVWSHPAIANGRFYVRNDKEIICVSLKGE